MKKYSAEFFGTFVLVLFGCGTAAIAGAAGAGTAVGTLGIALAFGLAIVAAAYAIGDISGCHVNPAVSFAMLLAKKMSGKDFVGYVIAQVLGAIAASAILMVIINSEVGLGQNGFGANSAVNLSMFGAIIVEIILTFVFVMTIFGVTSSEKTSHMGGLVIGLCLAFVHIMGIPLTGTSVNPARSLAPALFMGGEALSQVWVFIVAPLVGAALAALVWGFLSKKDAK
ncbi:MAG: MIP family channel protein [Oscillospiraceae bacterium]